MRKPALVVFVILLALLPSSRFRRASLSAPPAGTDSRPLQPPVSLPPRASLYSPAPARSDLGERSRARHTLLSVQPRLGPQEALLSFSLGETSVHLWTLTANRLEFHRLADAKQITALVYSFRDAVELNMPRRDDLGFALYHLLFGQVNAEIRRKPQWLLTADDALFEIPFAALVVHKQGGNPVYLVQEHSTQRIPSALLLGRPRAPLPRRGFLGIGDGIYNTADPRWTAHRAHDFPTSGDSSQQLARLPASGKELEACAREWRGMTAPILLTGLQATRQTLEASLGSRPGVIHIAAHVLHPKSKPGQAWIDLGLSALGEQEILTEEDIAALHVTGSTVVMSGCGSAADKSLPGAGILGLTLAWLNAGARAVVGSKWPTPDDTGELFQSFYRDLRNRCDRGADGRIVGASLQHAQQDMLRSATWRANPSYWSAFYVVGKE